LKSTIETSAKVHKKQKATRLTRNDQNPVLQKASSIESSTGVKSSCQIQGEEEEYIVTLPKLSPTREHYMKNGAPGFEKRCGSGFGGFP
jgi:hypothetical protein